MASRLAFPLNLLVFCGCAWIAYHRNISALFYHWDGLFAVTLIHNQILFSESWLNLTNDFMQEVGNIQFPLNYRLLFLFWPVFFIKDSHIAIIATYIIVAIVLFVIGYVFSRELKATRPVALTAAWLLAVVTTPFVPSPFFYHIISVSPNAILFVLFPVLTLHVIRPIGRFSPVIDIVSGLILIVLAWYLLVAAPVSAVTIIAGIALYALLGFCLTSTWAEFLRKCAVLAGVALITVILQWPLYLFGLLSYTAPIVFPQDFTQYYNQASFVSILFMTSDSGWAGQLLVVAGALGAILTLREPIVIKERRVAASTLLCIIAILLACGWIVPKLPRDIAAPPLRYVEVAIWPLYAMFASAAIVKFVSWVAGPGLRFLSSLGKQAAAEWLVPIPAMVVAFALASINPPTQPFMPFPPGTTSIVDHLRREIGLIANAPFRGRVATIIPVLPNDSLEAASEPGLDPYAQQWQRAMYMAKITGNDHSGPGLWYFQIPTLFEYNQLISPRFHALAKRTLYSPPQPHLRNNVLLTDLNQRILQLLGVRYVILADPLVKPAGPIAEIGYLRDTVMEGPRRWRLFELDDPNLATYSPTILEVRQRLDDILDVVTASDTDLMHRAIVESHIDGPLIPAYDTLLSFERGDLHFRARSSGRSLVVVPLEYSACIELRPSDSNVLPSTVSLHRVNGLLTGILFDREADVILSFRIGPFHNPRCRLDDYYELKSQIN